MTITEMHYDFKQKLNKIDSQQYRSLRIPEIDWKINEAIGLYIKMIAQPRTPRVLGFELNQRTIDDIRPIVKNNISCALSSIAGTDDFLATLPNDYQHYIGAGKVVLAKNNCTVNAEKIYLRQHDDDFQSSAFDRSSFLWREVNIRFYEQGIRIFTSGDFTVSSFNIDYIRQHVMVHNADNYTGNTYNTVDGVALTGTQDCELPKHTHPEIIDLAVLIATGDLNNPDYQFKQNKLKFNQV